MNLERSERPTVDDDRDVADLAWLSGLVGWLRRRLFPDDGATDADRNGDQPATTASSVEAEHPEPAAEDPDPAPVEPSTAGATLEEGIEEGAELAAEAPPTVEPRAEAPPKAEGRSERVRRSTAYRFLARRYTLAVAFAVFMGLVCAHNLFDGVDWGDDWALYVRQAKALTEGRIGEILADNRFTVDNSGWQSFSPYAYPWGWPALMAPFIAVFGLDYQVLKLLSIVALCAFLIAFYAIVRRRLGTLPSLLLVAAVGLSRSFNGATDGVLSDLPFLCLVGLGLWWMDVCRERGLLTLGRRHAVVLGLLLGFAYNIRREGLALWVALLALHLTVLAGVAVAHRSGKALRKVDWTRIALPYATIAAFVVLFQLLLPTVFLPRAPGMGLSNMPFRYNYYQDVVAEHIGLKDPGVAMELFGSSETARRALLVLGILAFVGMICRLLLRFEQEIHLATYLSATTFLMMISPYQDSRYFFTITPLLLYFAYQALPAITEITSGSKRLARMALVPPLIALVGVVGLNAGDLRRAYDYHSVYHYTVNGPESPEAEQMFRALRDVSRGDDIVLFFRARAMNLYADRRAIQGSNLDQLLKRSDWYVMAKDSTYSQTLLNDQEAAARGLTKAWENGAWVIWRVPPPS